MQLTPGFPYIFGVDPAWRGTRNELSYFNSLKMKASVMYASPPFLTQTHAHAHYMPYSALCSDAQLSAYVSPPVSASAR